MWAVVVAATSIVEHGARCDGATHDTAAFVRAGLAGGLVTVPAGRTCLTGPFNLTSGATLRLEPGSVVKALDDVKLWPVIPPLPSYGRGRDARAKEVGRRVAFVGMYEAHGAAIEGSGTLDGSGARWWATWNSGTVNETATRGHLVEIYNSTDVRVEGVTLLNSPYWTVHPVYSSRLVFRGLTILAPHDSPNTDGIDPDSSSDVLIEDCYISNGDDCVAIKSGWDCFGLDFNRPSENILIRNLTCTGSHGAAGLAIGSEMSGGVRNVTLVDSYFFNLSANAVNIKSTQYRGGFVEDVLVQNLTVAGAANIKGSNSDHGAVLRIAADYGSNNPSCAAPVVHLPRLRRVTFRDIRGFANRSAYAVQLSGLPGAPVEAVTFENVHLAAGPWSCSGVEGLRSHDVSPPSCASELVV